MLSAGHLLFIFCACFCGCAQADEEPRSRASAKGTASSLFVPSVAPAAEAPSRVLIARTPSPHTLEVLRSGLVSTDWMTRLTTTMAIGCVPAAPLAWLEQRLADVEEDVRAEAIASLALRSEPRARTLLRSVQNDTKEHLSLRVLAASALARPIQTCN